MLTQICMFIYLLSVQGVGLLKSSQPDPVPHKNQYSYKLIIEIPVWDMDLVKNFSAILCKWNVFLMILKNQLYSITISMAYTQMSYIPLFYKFTSSDLQSLDLLCHICKHQFIFIPTYFLCKEEAPHKFELEENSDFKTGWMWDLQLYPAKT